MPVRTLKLIALLALCLITAPPALALSEHLDKGEGGLGLMLDVGISRRVDGFGVRYERAYRGMIDLSIGFQTTSPSHRFGPAAQESALSLDLSLMVLLLRHKERGGSPVSVQVRGDYRKDYWSVDNMPDPKSRFMSMGVRLFRRKPLSPTTYALPFGQLEYAAYITSLDYAAVAAQSDHQKTLVLTGGISFGIMIGEADRWEKSLKATIIIEPSFSIDSRGPGIGLKAGVLLPR